MINWKMDRSNCCKIGAVFSRLLLIITTILVEVVLSQYYGRYVPCPKSYMDPDSDCLAGIGGKDYPMLNSIPSTSFDCRKYPVHYVGYFADVEAECQVFHVCLNLSGAAGRRDSFLCPNGTLFNQQFLVCDWWFNVKCHEAQKLYTINEYLEAPPVNFRLGPLSPKVVPIPAVASSEKKKGQSIWSSLLFGPSTSGSSKSVQPHGSVNSVPLTAPTSDAIIQSGGEQASWSVPVSASMSYQNPWNIKQDVASGSGSNFFNNLLSFVKAPSIKAKPLWGNGVPAASGPSDLLSSSVIQPRSKLNPTEPPSSNSDLKRHQIDENQSSTIVKKQNINIPGSPR